MLRWLCALVVLASPVRSEDVAGAFDYYVLSLSWSANWCAYDGDARGSPQCDPANDFGWVLHGLWPQHNLGYPEYCRTSFAPPTRRQTADMAEIMGTAGLAWHQWNKHGVCSGLSSADYYRLSREAFASINRPEVLRRVRAPITLPASVIEEAFLRDNPVLTPDGITITCRQGYIQEARICLTHDLVPRTCGPDVVRDCTMTNARFEPIR